MQNFELSEKLISDIRKSLKEKLTEIYSGFASANRINELAGYLLRVIVDTNEKLIEVLYFVDEFEGGVSDDDRFESVLAFVLDILPINKENAQRVFDFFKCCSKNKTVYVALTSRFYVYLTEEQKSFLS